VQLLPTRSTTPPWRRLFVSSLATAAIASGAPLLAVMAGFFYGREDVIPCSATCWKSGALARTEPPCSYTVWSAISEVDGASMVSRESHSRRRDCR
jgi:hypothetical protein